MSSDASDETHAVLVSRGPAIAIVAAFCLCGAGCASFERRSHTGELLSAERLDRGYTIALPGTTGNAPLDHEIVKGLLDADLKTAIELYDWTDGPLLILSNLRGLNRNRREAQELARRIVAYQDQYPGRPVHLIGYSTGAAMTVLTLEALPANRRVTSAILMAATLSSDYDLRTAMSHVERGILNYHSPFDIPTLGLVMTVLGTTDGRHTAAAGVVGFKVPESLDPQHRQWYQQALTQRKYTFDMAKSGHLGGHFGWINPTFVREWLAPLIIQPKAS